MGISIGALRRSLYEIELFFKGSAPGAPLSLHDLRRRWDSNPRRLTPARFPSVWNGPLSDSSKSIVNYTLQPQKNVLCLLFELTYEYCCAPGGIRTHDLSLRRGTL